MKVTFKAVIGSSLFLHLVCYQMIWQLLYILIFNMSVKSKQDHLKNKQSKIQVSYMVSILFERFVVLICLLAIKLVIYVFLLIFFQK